MDREKDIIGAVNRTRVHTVIAGIFAVRPEDSPSPFTFINKVNSIDLMPLADAMARPRPTVGRSPPRILARDVSARFKNAGGIYNRLRPVAAHTESDFFGDGDEGVRIPHSA